MIDPYFTEQVVPRPELLGGGNWQLRNLNSITVVFGKNGSGKSLLLRAWRDRDVDNIHYVVPERSGAITFEPGFLIQEYSGQERSGQSRRNYLIDYRQRVVTRIQAYFTTRGNVRKDELPGDPGDLERLIGQLIPDFAIELDGRSNPPYRLMRTSDQSQVGGIDQLSSGEAQILTLGLDILTVAAIWDIENREQRLVLIDEPDAHLHPDLQVRLADFIVQVASKFRLQVVIATHSTAFLAGIGQFGDDRASVIYLDRTATNFEAQPFSAITKELSACLGGHALMGPLFGVPMLLVEGDDDYRIWSQVPRHHVISLAVIPAHGDEIKRYQKSLEQIFSVLREPGQGVAGYALIDGDKGKPQPNPGTPQNHVKYIQLSCHESENLYLTDVVLASLGFDWKNAVAKITADADQYGNKEEKLSNAANWNRKTQDIKKVIEELGRILDKKNVHWTVRVAHAIGRKKPEGDLADFLGEEVVGSLWS